MTENTDDQDQQTIQDYLGAIKRVLESVSAEGNWKKSIGTKEMRWINGDLNPQETVQDCVDALNNIIKAIENEAENS